LRLGDFAFQSKIMTDIPRLLLGTLTNRPYVFAFLVVYLFLAFSKIGWRRTLVYTVMAYIIAWACEWSSVHNGFPFGLYYYIDKTSHLELWVAGVPFFDSLSFAFLAYVSYELAVILRSPVRLGVPGFVAVDETPAIRSSWVTTIYAGILMTFLDIVIDPLTLQGDRWFLGKIYYYPNGGQHFGVTITNYIGWFSLSVFISRAFLLVERFFLAKWPVGGFDFPFKSVAPIGLYFGILGFNLTMTFRIGEITMGWASAFLVILLILLVFQHFNSPYRTSGERP
jgi:uncharacterized membrane protein